MRFSDLPDFMDKSQTNKKGRPGRPSRGYETKAQAVYLHPLIREALIDLAIRARCSVPRAVELVTIKATEAFELKGDGARPGIRSQVPFGEEVARLYSDAEKEMKKDAESWRAIQREAVTKSRHEAVERAAALRSAAQLEREAAWKMKAEEEKRKREEEEAAVLSEVEEAKRIWREQKIENLMNDIL